MADLSAFRVEQYLADLRDRGRAAVPLDPDKAQYTRGELAKLLGVKGQAITDLVRRHRLQGTGNGKARRYPKTVAEALLAMRVRGRSIKTSNLYLEAVKQFAGWLVQDRRTAETPFNRLARGDVKLDRRHDRRPMSLEELRAVIQAAGQSARVFRGLAGLDRAVLYTLACASGFRASELASLCPDDFDLVTVPATVTLSAGNAKNGKTAIQPLAPDVAEALSVYLAGCAAGQPVWRGTWPEKAAEMFSIDLAAAGISYSVEGPDWDPLFADFHSLRHSMISLLDKSGATLKEAMQLARHSDPKLTMAVYGRAQLHALGEAVGRMPSSCWAARLLAKPPNLPPCRRRVPMGRRAVLHRFCTTS